MRYISYTYSIRGLIVPECIRVLCPCQGVCCPKGFTVPIACLISNRWLNGISKIFLNANDSYYTLDANDSQIQMILIILRMILIYRMKIFLAWFLLRTPVSSSVASCCCFVLIMRSPDKPVFFQSE